jgi:cobalt/nickel transport system permease protein
MPVEALQRASCLDGNSILHRCDARIKIVLLLGYLLAVALLPIGAWPVYVLMGGLLLIADLLSELPITILLQRSFLLEVPILLILLPQIFLRTGNYIEVRMIGDFTMPVSFNGLERVASLIVRSWLSLQFAVLITAVTKFEDLLAGLRSCGLPRMLAAILGLMWRYLFIMLEEVKRMQQARAARTSTDLNLNWRGGGSLIWRAAVTGNMAGNLLLRSMMRSERIFQAMQARGYDGDIRIGQMPCLVPSQRLLILIIILTGILLVLLAYGMGA